MQPHPQQQQQLQQPQQQPAAAATSVAAAPAAAAQAVTSGVTSLFKGITGGIKVSYFSRESLTRFGINFHIFLSFLLGEIFEFTAKILLKFGALNAIRAFELPFCGEESSNEYFSTVLIANKLGASCSV